MSADTEIPSARAASSTSRKRGGSGKGGRPTPSAGAEGRGHEAPCLTARLAGSERMDAETKRAVRNQRSHVHRKTDALQMRKVVADSLPAPGEGSRRHPAVDLGKDLGGAAEERRRAKAAVSQDLRRDALVAPSFEVRN